MVNFSLVIIMAENILLSKYSRRLSLLECMDNDGPGWGIFLKQFGLVDILSDSTYH